MLKNKTSPYDFFLNLLSVGLLYFSVGALVSVAFSVINNIFPDPIGGYYENIVSSWSLAVLLILFPVYVWTVKKLKTSIEKEPKREEARSRRWMINFTIFIAAIIILGSFVSIVFRFLEGELTIIFLSKALFMLLVSGIIIGFYRDFLNVDSDNKKRMRLLSIASISLVVFVVILGFWFSDSPFDKRSIKIDQERVQDLGNIQSAIYEDWRATGFLPTSLEEISDPWFSEDTFYDPITGEMYEYNVLGESIFELCATFDMESSDHFGDYYYPRPYPGGDALSNNWNHTAGMNCFERTMLEQLNN